MPHRLVALVGVFCLALAAPGWAGEPDYQAAADLQTLKDANLSPEGPALLAFFRSRTLSDVDRTQIAAEIRKLGSESFEEREGAEEALVKMGAPAVSLLRQATRADDIEVVRRAEQCLQRIDKVAGAAVTAAAARELGRRKPAGTADALLAFVPYADDDAVLDAVRAGLAATALRDGKPEKSVVEALKDTQAVRRGVAAEALARSGSAEQRQVARRFLKDPDKLIRLRVGLALVEAHDKAAVPPVIDLLAELPRDQVWQIEDLLYRLAGEQAPLNLAPGIDEPSRRRYRDAWSAWWSKQGERIDLAKLDGSRKLLGYTLVVELGNRGGNVGMVVEYGPDGKPRWQIGDLVYPMDAQVVAADRVLITEYQGRRITERNFKGEILWTKDVPNLPLAAQRLPGGATFIVSRNQLVELEPNGKEGFNYSRPTFDITCAQKMRNGHVAFLTQQGQFVVLDAAGKELKSFTLGPGHLYGGNFEALPNGHFLVPLYNQSKVVELDGDGKTVWEAAAPAPSCVQRLPNGNTLVGSMYNQQYVELDRAGKPVGDPHSTEGRVQRVRRR